MTVIKSDCLVTVIAPVCNNGRILEKFGEELFAVLSSHFANYEVVLVDDGSTDNSKTVAEGLLSRFDCFRYIKLSRRCGNDIAICAGFETSIGDYVVAMLPEFDPPEHVPALVALLEADNGIIIGRSKHCLYGFIRRLIVRLFAWLCMSCFGLRIYVNSTYLFAISRPSLNALHQIRDRFRYFKTCAEALVVEPIFFEYEMKSRSGARWGRTMYEAVNLAIDIIVSNTTRPLRYISLFGLSVSLINLLYFGYIGVVALFKRHVQEGWITLSTQNALSFFVLNLVLAIACEYIGRILMESKERPPYFIKEERNSSVLITDRDHRINIVESSMPRAN